MYLALDINRKREFFDTSFYWKLSYDQSLLSFDWLSSVSGSKVMS